MSKVTKNVCRFFTLKRWKIIQIGYNLIDIQYSFFINNIAAKERIENALLDNE